MSQQNHSDSGQFSKILSLKFILGSWPLGYKLILEGNAVNVTPDPCSFNNEPMTCIPSIEEWNKFLESIERLDVLNWKESYIDPDQLEPETKKKDVLTEMELRTKLEKRAKGNPWMKKLVDDVFAW